MPLADSESIKQRALELGFTTVGIASAHPPDSLDFYDAWLAAGFHGAMEYMARHREAKADLNRLLPGVTSVVAVTLNYNQPGNGRFARYAIGRDYHKVIGGKLKALSREMEGQSRVCVDSVPLLEREYAHRAGLGWFGKNTLLIDSKRGSWFLLGFLLTTLDLATDEPSPGGCGTCRACIDACPTGAIVQLEDRWAVDSKECLSYLTIEAPEPTERDLHGWVFGCDICQQVCPFNQPRETQPLRGAQTTEPDFLKRNPLVGADLSALDFETWDRESRGSPIRRAGFHKLKMHGDPDR